MICDAMCNTLSFHSLKIKNLCLRNFKQWDSCHFWRLIKPLWLRQRWSCRYSPRDTEKNTSIRHHHTQGRTAACYIYSRQYTPPEVYHCRLSSCRERKTLIHVPRTCSNSIFVLLVYLSFSATLNNFTVTWRGLEDIGGGEIPDTKYRGRGFWPASSTVDHLLLLSFLR
jgi:hypothetical protein